MILLNIENWAEVSASFATPLIMMADLLDDHACLCLASLLQVQIRMTILQIRSCRDWKCFHPWLPLLVDIHGWSGNCGLPFLFASNPKCFQTGVMVFCLATSLILGSVSSSPALAGSIHTRFSLIAMLKAGHAC